MNKGLVSCIISTYNTERVLLYASIKSIIDQTYKNIELIIVDDGSNYSVSNFVLENFNDNRIKIITNESNQGVTKSRNIALKLCRGEYLAVMDADDISKPERFENEIKFLNNHKKYQLVSSQMEVVYATKTNKTQIKLPNNPKKYECMLFWDNSKPFPHGPAMIKMDFLIKNNIEYNEKYKKALDYRLWVDCAHFGGRFKVLDKYLYKYRIHDNQISRKQRSDQLFFADMICIDQLKNLVEELSDDDIQKHLLLRDSNPTLSVENAIDWSQKLIDANNYKKYYSKKFFDDEVKYRLFKLAYKNYKLKKTKPNKKKMTKLLNAKIIFRLFRIKAISLLSKKSRTLVVEQNE